MKNIQYFLFQAHNSLQPQFELDFADVIVRFDLFETALITEDGVKLIISWKDNGRFESYEAIHETSESKTLREVEVLRDVIGMLKEINVDGETMQFIIEQVGMEEQMLRQLVMSSPYTDTSDLLEEKVQLSDAGIHL